jgi:hypothetical protein
MLTPPPPISPVFEDNVDKLIQDLLRNQKGIGFSNPQALLKRQKEDEATVYEILEKIKLLSTSTGVTDGDKGDITVSGGGTVWTIDDGVITDSKISDVDWSKITNAPVITNYTDSDARAAISLTTSGSSGAATYNSTTGVLNIPVYQFTGWNLNGNIGTSNINDFLGTVDNQGLNLRTNNINRFQISSSGNIGIGLTPSNFRFHVRASGTGVVPLHAVDGTPNGTGAGSLISAEYRNTHSTNNKVQITIGGGSIGTNFNRTWSLGTDVNGNGTENFYIYSGNTLSSVIFIDNSDRVLINNSNTIQVTTTPSAELEVRSINRGFLPPRMTQIQRNAIGSPATGLLTYQTDNTENLYLKKSTAWKRILTEDDSVTSTIGTNSNVLIDCGSFLAPNENILIDCGSFITVIP